MLKKVSPNFLLVIILHNFYHFFTLIYNSKIIKKIKKPFIIYIKNHCDGNNFVVNSSTPEGVNLNKYNNENSAPADVPANIFSNYSQ